MCININPGSAFKVPKPFFPEEPESPTTTPPEKENCFKKPAAALRELLKAVELAEKVDGDPNSASTMQEARAILEIPPILENWSLDANDLILELSAFVDSLKARRAAGISKK